MASLNTLTGLGPVIYEALDVVAAEKTGFIGACTIDPSAANAAVGQSITTFQTPAVTASTAITPSNVAPDSGGQVITPVEIKITKSQMVPVQWTGDEQMLVRGQVNNMLRDQIAQAIRTLRNEQEADLAAAARLGSSRAFGTSGTAPFNTANDTSDFAAITRILDDNGVPDMDRSLVLSPAAVQNLRGKQGLLNKVNEAGSAEFVRSGALLDMYGLAIRQSRQVAGSGTVGTGSGYKIDGTGNLTVGSTTLKLKTGTGTILAGDVITIGAHKYVVKTALTSTLVEIQAPGLQAAVVDGDDVTVNAAYTGNVAFHRSALVLATRAPAMPLGGDSADDVMDVVDPYTGVVYQMALYKGYRQVRIEIGQAWGVKAVKPAFSALLLG